MSRPNIYSPEFDVDRDKGGFHNRRATLGLKAGAQRLGMSLYELAPGETSLPYHWHRANEELLIVVSGQPSLRTPRGWRELAEGEVVSFPASPEGAHMLSNRSDEPVRFLIASTMRGPEVTHYPDSDKVMTADWRRGGAEVFFANFRIEDQVDYYEGEEAPSD